jgi:hypothetical protein
LPPFPGLIAAVFGHMGACRPAPCGRDPTLKDHRRTLETSPLAYQAFPVQLFSLVVIVAVLRPSPWIRLFGVAVASLSTSWWWPSRYSSFWPRD